MQIQQAGSALAHVQIRSGPIYLISLLNGVLSPFFIATKIDEGPSTVRAVGFFAKPTAKLSNLLTNYSTMLAASKSEDIIEISFPWHQVCSIQNLIYRHKGSK